MTEFTKKRYVINEDAAYNAELVKKKSFDSLKCMHQIFLPLRIVFSYNHMFLQHFYTLTLMLRLVISYVCGLFLICTFLMQSVQSHSEL